VDAIRKGKTGVLTTDERRTHVTDERVAQPK
jgi:hypothetical protein